MSDEYAQRRPEWWPKDEFPEKIDSHTIALSAAGWKAAEKECWEATSARLSLIRWRLKNLLERGGPPSTYAILDDVEDILDELGRII